MIPLLLHLMIYDSVVFTLWISNLWPQHSFSRQIPTGNLGLRTLWLFRSGKRVSICAGMPVREVVQSRENGKTPSSPLIPSGSWWKVRQAGFLAGHSSLFRDSVQLLYLWNVPPGSGRDSTYKKRWKGSTEALGLKIVMSMWPLLVATATVTVKQSDVTS
jgi:hypothetical protein